MQQMLLEGKTFVGCLQSAPKATVASAATTGTNATSVADLLAPLKPADTVVLTERTLTRQGALFLKNTKLTVATLASAAASSPTTIPGRAGNPGMRMGVMWGMPKTLDQ